jgi:hypothetical protein
VFLGASTPSILRRTAIEGTWALVVDAYVHGVMDGTMIRQVESGKRKLEWFGLV